MKRKKSKWFFKFGLPHRWYFEYHSGIRWNVYFMFMIARFPILALVKWDDPEDKRDWQCTTLALMGFFFEWRK